LAQGCKRGARLAIKRRPGPDENDGRQHADGIRPVRVKMMEVMAKKNEVASAASSPMKFIGKSFFCCIPLL